MKIVRKKNWELLNVGQKVGQKDETASKILQKMVCEGEKWRFTNPTNPVQLIGGLQSMDWNSQSRNSGLLDRFHWIAQIPILGLGFRNLEKRGSWIDFQGLCNPNPRIIQSLQSNPCNPIHGLQKMPSTFEVFSFFGVSSVSMVSIIHNYSAEVQNQFRRCF